MKEKSIKSEKEYQEALSRAMQIFHAQEGTPEDFGLRKLLHLKRILKKQMSK